MIKNTIILLFVLLNYCNGQFTTKVNNYGSIYQLFQWKLLEFDFNGVKFTKDTPQRYGGDSVYFKEDWINENEYFFNQTNNIPVGFESFQDLVFITVPRLRYGVPSTLNVVGREENTTKPLLRPYPDVNSVSSFVSIHRPSADLECNTLWVVDTGLIDVPGNHIQVKAPEVIIFDLLTNTEILRHQLKPSVLVNGTTSGLTSVTVDSSDTECDNAHGYITDQATGGIIVFSLKEKDSWRFSHPSLMYDSGASNFKIRDQNIDWKYGVSSISLTDPDSNGIRTAYYHPLVATQEFSITTDILKDRNGDFEKNFKLVGVRGPWSQSTAHIYYPKTKTMFFANVARDGILCWNIDKPLTTENVPLIAHNKSWLSYISDIKLVVDNIWMLVNNMPMFHYSKLEKDPEIPHFQLLWVAISDLVNGTACEQKT